MSTRIRFHYSNKFPLRYYKTLAIPVEISGMYSIWKHKHFVEISGGLTYLNSTDIPINHTENILIVALRIGYRFQKPESGLYLKVGFTPLYDLVVQNPNVNAPHHTWLMSGGIGIGYTF